jgi:hypothetical protein
VGQITLTDVEAKEWLHHLTARDLEVLDLIGREGLTASQVSRLKRISRTGISRLVVQAEELHLLTATTTRPYNKRYRVEKPLQALLSSTETPGRVRPYTTCRPHNIRLKYRIILQEGPLSRDRRAGYLKSWKPRGPERLLYRIPGRVDMGDVTIEAHPGSLVAYYSAHQEVVAESVKSAEALILTSIHEAVLRFVVAQARFGNRMDLESPTSGKATAEALQALQVTATHYAFKASRAGPLGAMVGQRAGPWWVDGSPRDEGDPDHIEVETQDLPEATDLDQAIRAVKAGPPATAGPEILAAMEMRLRPLEAMGERVEAIHAMVSSGTTLEYKYHQVVGILAQTMGHLEKALGRIERLEKKVYREDSTRLPG